MAAKRAASAAFGVRAQGRLRAVREEGPGRSLADAALHPRSAVSPNLPMLQIARMAAL